jgi:CRP/FNR family transcriptional regulator, cyclic AMP receptor protein
MKPEELKRIEVLHAMDDEALARLTAALEEKSYADGQVVFAEGDPGDSMYFILQGHIRIEKRAGAAGAAHKLLTVLDDGDYFGEMALLDQKPRSASAVAAGCARILRLSKAAFDQLQASGGVGMSILFAMIRTSSERIRRLSGQLVVYDEVGKAIGEARDLQSLLDVILHQLLSATSADWGLFLLRSEFSELLEIRGQANLTLTPEQIAAIGNGEGFLGPALKNTQDWVVADFDVTEPFRSCKRLGFETPSLVLSPIAVEGKLLGLILLGGKERDGFDVNALNLTRGVARQAGQAILNARHREEQEARSRHSRQFVRF